MVLAGLSRTGSRDAACLHHHHRVRLVGLRRTPPSPLPLPVGPRGLPVGPLTSPKSCQTPPLPFASPSKRPLRDGTQLTPPPPLLGFVLLCVPLFRPAFDRPLPEEAPKCSLFRAPAATPMRRVPPSWFRTTSTVCSGLQVPGLLHPGAGCEVRCVSVTTDCQSPKTRQTGQGTFPSARFTPFEDFPSSAAVPHHCGRCPRAVHRGRPSEDDLPFVASMPSPSALRNDAPGLRTSAVCRYGRTAARISSSCAAGVPRAGPASRPRVCTFQQSEDCVPDAGASR
jgi:hypothetical protein